MNTDPYFSQQLIQSVRKHLDKRLWGRYRSHGIPQLRCQVTGCRDVHGQKRLATHRFISSSYRVAFYCDLHTGNFAGFVAQVEEGDEL